MFFVSFLSCVLQDFKFWYVNRKAFGESFLYWVDFTRFSLFVDTSMFGIIGTIIYCVRFFFFSFQYLPNIENIQLGLKCNGLWRLKRLTTFDSFKNVLKESKVVKIVYCTIIVNKKSLLDYRTAPTSIG